MRLRPDKRPESFEDPGIRGRGRDGTGPSDDGCFDTAHGVEAGIQSWRMTVNPLTRQEILSSGGEGEDRRTRAKEILCIPLGHGKRLVVRKLRMEPAQRHVRTDSPSKRLWRYGSRRVIKGVPLQEDGMVCQGVIPRRAVIEPGLRFATHIRPCDDAVRPALDRRTFVVDRHLEV